jgi:hypothetical protein
VTPPGRPPASPAGFLVTLIHHRGVRRRSPGERREGRWEAAASGVDLRGVRVSAEGGFDTDSWSSTGITYSVEIDSDAPADELARLLATVDEVAEIPRALRAGAAVRRTR